MSNARKIKSFATALTENPFYEILLENQTIQISTASSQTNRKQQLTDKNCPELANTKSVIFHQSNTQGHISLGAKQ